RRLRRPQHPRPPARPPRARARPPPPRPPRGPRVRLADGRSRPRGARRLGALPRALRGRPRRERPGRLPLPRALHRVLLHARRPRGPRRELGLPRPRAPPPRPERARGPRPRGEVMNGPLKLVVGIGGASGMIYARRLLAFLAKHTPESDVRIVFSKTARAI